MKDRESWVLDGDVLDDGEGKAIDLSAVTHAYFSDTRHDNGRHWLRLRLFTPDQKMTMACLSKQNYGGRASCRRLQVAVMQRLHEVNPDARVHVEGGPFKQLLWFVGCLAMALGALAMFVAGVNGSQMIAVVIGLLATVGFGYGSFHFLPWPSTKFERSPIEAANHIADASP